MNVSCPSCDEYVDLPDAIDPKFGEPCCACCGSPLAGYSSEYRECGRCRNVYMATYSACVVCDYPAETRQEVLAASSGQGRFQSPAWYAYTIDKAARSLKLSYKLVDELSQVPGVLAEIGAASVLAVDTETSGLDPFTCELILLQIATPACVYIFDTRSLDKAQLAVFLKPILENKNLTTVLHNANFDYKFIKVHLGITLGNIFDTMLAHSLLSAGTHISGSLKAILKRTSGSAFSR